MIERARARFGLTPSRLAADSAYGSGLLIGWLMRRGIEPHVPVIDRETQTGGLFTRAQFTFDRERDLYLCPQARSCATRATPARMGCAATKPTRSIAVRVRHKRSARPERLAW